MTRERAKFSLGDHVMRQLLGVVGLSITLSHCHVFAAKLQGLPETLMYAEDDLLHEAEEVEEKVPMRPWLLTEERILVSTCKDSRSAVSLRSKGQIPLPSRYPNRHQKVEAQY